MLRFPKLKINVFIKIIIGNGCTEKTQRENGKLERNGAELSVSKIKF